MQLGSSSKHGVIVGQYGADRDANEHDKNSVIGWAEPACDDPSWIIWFTKQGDAIIHAEREPGGGVVGDPIMLKARTGRKQRYSEAGALGAIGSAAADLKEEADRVANLSAPLKETITCGELDKLLHNLRHSTKLLKKIK